MNMITACQLAEYAELGFKVFAYSPGYTTSNIEPKNKVEYAAKPTSQGVVAMARLLNEERDAERGWSVHEVDQHP